jgi:hypothetical protein
MASDAALTSEDLELLDRLARRVVELRMDLPAILTLETSKPLSLLAGQSLVFFEPIVQSLFAFPDYRRLALVIERREGIEALIQRIERCAEQARLARRQAKTGPPAGGSAS